MNSFQRRKQGQSGKSCLEYILLVAIIVNVANSGSIEQILAPWSLKARDNALVKDKQKNKPGGGLNAGGSQTTLPAGENDWENLIWILCSVLPSCDPMYMIEDGEAIDGQGAEGLGGNFTISSLQTGGDGRDPYSFE